MDPIALLPFTLPQCGLQLCAGVNTLKPRQRRRYGGKEKGQSEV
jgi:hypothetical protein